MGTYKVSLSLLFHKSTLDNDRINIIVVFMSHDNNSCKFFLNISVLNINGRMRLYFVRDINLDVYMFL